MTTRELLRWQRTHAQREAHAGSWWTSPTAASILSAGVLSALVYWRCKTSVSSGSDAWLAATLVAFAVTFLRVPARLYWRSDAPLLAQLPIPGAPLFDAAVVRCVASAVATTAIAVLGAVPLLLLDADLVGAATRTLQAVPIAGDPVPRLTPLALFIRHLAVAAGLGAAAAALIPAVALWAASLVATGRADRAIRTATVLAGGGPADHTPSSASTSSGAGVLGALPGVASSAVIVVAILVAPWLLNREPPIPAGWSLAVVAIGSVVALAAMRAIAAHTMPAIFREVSALDRQQLATLELHPPTRLERSIASLLGEASLPYRKDARLIRRRYPMAFFLGAVAFVAIVIIGIARPVHAEPWLAAAILGAVLYGAVLAKRLWRPPIELPHLANALPISRTARTRAKLAWLATWAVLFVAVPAAFALVRFK